MFANIHSGHLSPREISSFTENYVDERGFHVRHPGLAIPADSPMDPNDPKLFFRIADLSVLYLAGLFENVSMRQKSWEALGKMKRPAIILARAAEDRIGNALKPGFQLAALVDRINNEDEAGSEIPCTYEGRALLYYLAESGSGENELGATPKNTLSAQSLGKVPWCIR